MPKQTYTASEAAAALGISLDTLRRWDKSGRIRVQRDRSNRVTEVQVDGLMAQVEMVVNEPVRLVSIVTRDAVEELGLKDGMPVTAIVKSTNVMIQSQRKGLA
jgi:molybdopterin-binding protein